MQAANEEFEKRRLERKAAAEAETIESYLGKQFPVVAAMHAAFANQNYDKAIELAKSIDPGSDYYCEKGARNRLHEECQRLIKLSLREKMPPAGTVMVKWTNISTESAEYDRKISRLLKKQNSKREEMARLLKRSGHVLSHGLDDGTLVYINAAVYNKTKRKEVSAAPKKQKKLVLAPQVKLEVTQTKRKKRKMENILKNVKAGYQLTLAVDLRAAGRASARSTSTVLAATDRFEKIHEDAEFEYGLNMVVTKRPRKDLEEPAAKAAPVAQAAPPAVPVHPGFPAKAAVPVPFRAKRNKVA
jgi:hypothetical protein